MASRGRERRLNQQSKACARKKRYDTREAAERDLSEVFGREHGEKRLNVYKCLACKGFHLGGTPTWRRPDR